jgi:hypothetical protein
MQDAGFMCSVDPGYDLLHDRGRSLQTESSFTPQQLIERLAFDVLHHQKKNAIGTLTKVGHINDVWVLDGSRRTSFTFKARNCLAFLQIFIIENVRSHSFYRHSAGHQVLVLGKIDLAHRTSAKPFLEEIAAREQAATGQRVFGVRFV